MPKDRLLGLLCVEITLKYYIPLFKYLLSCRNYDQMYLVQTITPLQRKKDPRKEKKICKVTDKCRDQSGRRGDWTKFERTTYARVLLKTMVHSVPVTDLFYAFVAELLCKSPRQVYAFHKRMLSEFRSRKQIIMHILGSIIAKAFSLKPIQHINKGDSTIVEQPPKKYPVLKLQSLIDTNSSQYRFQSEDLNFVQNFLFVEKTPDQMDYPQASFIQIQQDFDSDDDLEVSPQPIDVEEDLSLDLQ